MPTWPTTLPQQFLKNGYKETEPNLVLSFKADAGPPLTRKRCEANILPFSGSMNLTPAQKATLRTFYRTYCAGPFDFPDPDTGSPVAVMFVPDSPPEYAAAGGLFWKVDFKLMRLP